MPENPNHDEGLQLHRNYSRLRPIPDVNLRKKIRCTMDEYRVEKIRKRDKAKTLEQAAKHERIKRLQEPPLPPDEECHLPPLLEVDLNKMKEYARAGLRVHGLLPDWEQEMREWVPLKLRQRYSEMFEEQMEEVRARYFDIMSRVCLQSVLAIEIESSEFEDELIAPESGFRRPGRTENYNRYLRNRRTLSSRYHLSHRLSRAIVSKATRRLPSLICDFHKYRNRGYLNFTEFCELVNVDLERGAVAVTVSYHADISRIANEESRACRASVSLTRCTSGLLALQIIDRMTATMENLLDVITQTLRSPLLALTLKCDNNSLYTSPSLGEIKVSFHTFVDTIAHTAQHLPSIESMVKIRRGVGQGAAQLPDWYLFECHQRLDRCIDKAYAPMGLYVDGLRNKFRMVYEESMQRQQVARIVERKDFDECLEKIEEFNKSVADVHGMTENEYFDNCKLYQEEAKNGLKRYTEEVRKLIIAELVERHKSFNLAICSEFEALRKRALNIPDETEELLELGRYMVKVQTEVLKDLFEKIGESIHMMISLFEMTTLSKEHVELNNTTFNWTQNIKPVLEKNSMYFEQRKFELEERLQNRIIGLNKSIEDMFPKLVLMDDMDDANRVIEYLEFMRDFIRDIDRMEESVNWIGSEEALFGFPKSTYPKVSELRDQAVMPFYSLLARAKRWQRDRNVWLDGPFEYLVPAVVESRTNEHLQDFSKASKTFKTKIKMQAAMNYPYTFGGSVDDPDYHMQPAPMKLCHQLIEDVKWFKQYVPTVMCFCNPALRQRHWDEMSEIAGFDLTPNAGTTIRKIINMNLIDNMDLYEQISVGATKELGLQELLAKMKTEWDDVYFTTMPFKDSKVNILTQIDDIQALLEEHIVKVQAMRGSAFVKPIANEVKEFYELLLRVQKTLDEWAKVQVQWMYLLPIFSSKDIVAQLPEEGILFSEVDGTFRKAMQSVTREPSVRETAGSAGLWEAMKSANEMMERVNDGVTNYLEKKRLFFPRFFFLSNDDMLEILSETKDPLRVQPHLKKCFEGIAKLGFDEKLDIYSMISDDREEINFVESVSTEAARGCVEKWLVQVEEQMVSSVRQEILMSYRDYEVNSRVSWVRSWPGMVVLCVSQIYWSIQVQGALMTHMESAMTLLYQKLIKQIIDVVNLVKGQLSRQNRTTLNALITIDVHAQDVVKSLIENKITNETDFEWLAQLRYYWENDVIVRIINASVPYAYEYLGNCPRLVITPLTDRCYRTLIGAYSLHLNGAPEGPAGTGKTETTKDLGRALAVQCVVFNCSDGLDYKNMGKFFKGLASCGAWACFDEFNRIELEVLSVVAQQILCIVQAVRANLETFIFEGTELKLNPAVYVCITMNPGYAGRSELPDNLKVLFRTVAMMVPDYAMIGEIFLYSSGFASARVLAVKIVTTYKLCSEQLSSQSHYDYGMRAVKTVLTAAQNIKLRFPDGDETILLLRSIVDVNLPKFLAHDVPLFQGIISDLFPGVVLPSPNYDVLLRAVDVVAKKRNLQTTEGFLLKIIQTFEMMLVRHGFMLVGDPSGGKTTVLHTLAEALTLMHDWKEENGAVTKYITINPKSITMGQLYGQFDPVSSEWTDGVCAVAFRRFCSDESAERKWLIFDGPVDAVWIENLNTVLDDNKKLCLTSGEVMQMTNVMSMIFEVMDLLQASPATVSRCGMIYIEPHVLGWRPSVTSWVHTVNPQWRENHEDFINMMIDLYFECCLEFIRRKCVVTLTAGQINQVTSTLNLIEMFMNDAYEENDEGQDLNPYIDFWLQAAFLLALVWGMGGTLDVESREKFNDFITTIWRNEDPNHPLPEELGEEGISLPSDGLIHDNYYLFKGKGTWKYFFDVVKAEPIVETQSIGQMLIPTMDTVKYQHIFLRHIKHKKRFLLYGKTGTGKSFYIQDLMINKLNGDDYLPNFVTFTARTTAAQTQDLVISKLFKRRKGHYGPMDGAQCVCFIDDVNMPAKEIYGAQPAIELLRQFFDHELWYDLKEPEIVKIYDTMFVCAMAPPGGSRQEIYPRFLRHFNLYEISEFSNDSVFRIFSNVATFGLKRRGFASDINAVINNIVNATMSIFKGARTELLPTPAKSHYLFNLRDFSRVITGCTMIRKESVETKDKFIRLWTHEVLRVFGDRLIDTADNQWLFNQLKETVEKVFRESFDNIFGDLPKFDGKLTEDSLLHLIFGNFMDTDAVGEDRKYDEVVSMEEYKHVALQCLEEYNATHKSKLDIVLFRYALEHLARICRVLAVPAGSLLMVGVGGSGRQSLTRLASEMTGCGLFQPEIGSAYGTNEWRDDIKKVLKITGGGKDTVFLFTEGQIKDESFLADIDCLLNSGEVPNLFNIEERQEIVELTRLAAQGGNRNLDISVLSILRFFVNRCKEKLHIMLCFSPIGESFRTRLRMFPSLVNSSTIDWFQVWPEDALEQVALRSTTSINVTEEIKVNSVIACKYFHTCAKLMSDKFYRIMGRKTYVTSAAFLDLIKAFGVLMNEKQEEVSLARDRYIGGLEKLQFAAEQVSKMQETLTSLQPELEKSAKLTIETMKKIESENISVEKTTIIVKQEEDAANEQAKIAGALKAECEADLAEALPVLEDAIAALNTLKPSDITLVKSMKNPPEGVKLVMAAVCVMLSVPPDRVNDPTTGKMVSDYWGPSKRILSDMKFLDYLRDYDKDNINPNIMQIIEKVYLKDKNFEPSKVAKASQAAEGLCKWVRAMVLYDRIIKIVKPKQESLAEAERSYNETMNLLNKKREMLADLNDKLEALNEQLRETMETKVDLENQVILCSNKLIRAEKLISGLGGEKSRWTESAANLQRSYDCLPGDVLISCGMIAYLGPYTSAYRFENLIKWIDYVGELRIPRSDDYSFVTVLGSEIKINSWNIFGLPRDSFSTENAIIMDNTKRWSLFIDPQSQANKWIRNMEKSNQLEIVKLTDNNYMNIVEQCVEFGKSVLIENVGEELDAPLDPILAKNIYKVAGIWYITLGEKSLEYNLNFRLYITTKLRNPHYLPEVFNKVTLINFALTIEGLEDQLLGIVVAKERPDLQEKREYLIVQSAANKKALKQVEDDILRTLSTSGASILEDEEAIEILDSSKILSIDIQRKQEAAKETEVKIEVFRQSYKPIAKHSSALYYTITDLPNIDPMYQYSLAWFINLYVMSIETANKSNVLERRLAFLRQTFTYNLYQNVCRSLFEKDKILYSFILCTTIMQATGELPREELNFFLTGGIILPMASTLPNPAPDWLADRAWDEIRRAANLPIFSSLPTDFKPSHWQPFYDATEPQNTVLPEPWESRLSDFQKLIIMRMIRPDKVIPKVLQFVRKSMDARYVTPPAFDIARSYGDSNCLVPLIFILSPGSDPMGALAKFAEQSDYTSRFFAISLGQGQGPIARGLIQRAQEDGCWVCLQNCHLAVSWMSELEKICESLDITNTSINFRLWLTSYPSDKFPISVLQNGVKMTNEPPSGLQQNLMRSYLSEPVKDPDFFSGCPGKERTFTRLLYGLCFFHAVVQERRNYGAQGWNIPYGFNESDFQISAQQLQIFINDYDEVPFKAILYLTGECNYGGRVTDDRDRRCLNTILLDFYNVDVIKNPDYIFSGIGREYSLPKRCEYEDYIKQIESIPTQPSPEVLGLNMNAGITRDLDISKTFFDSLASMQGGVVAGDAAKQDELLLNLKSDIYDRLPEPFDLEETQKRHPASYSESMNTVLVQEMERFNVLLREMRSSLAILERAVRGLIVMTPELETMAAHMLAGKIPPSWRRSSAYPSLKPLSSFVNDFLERLNFFRNWDENGKPSTFWISGFSFVHAFLTGATQNYARKYKISIDLIDFDFEVLPRYESQQSPEDGVYVYGMYLSGARWDISKMKLAEAKPKLLNELMPLVWLRPRKRTEITERDRYSCPLYITSERFGTLKTTGHSTNYVLSILLNSGLSPAHWVKRGTALLCQLDD